MFMDVWVMSRSVRWMGAPVAEDDGGAAGAEQRAAEQECAVAAAVVVIGDVLVIHDQRGAAGHGLCAQPRQHQELDHFKDVLITALRPTSVKTCMLICNTLFVVHGTKPFMLSDISQRFGRLGIARGANNFAALCTE